MKYFKRGIIEKSGVETKNLKWGKAGSRDGCLKSGFLITGLLILQTAIYKILSPREIGAEPHL